MTTSQEGLFCSMWLRNYLEQVWILRPLVAGSMYHGVRFRSPRYQSILLTIVFVGKLRPTHISGLGATPSHFNDSVAAATSSPATKLHYIKCNVAMRLAPFMKFPHHAPLPSLFCPGSEVAFYALSPINLLLRSVEWCDPLTFLGPIH